MRGRSEKEDDEAEEEEEEDDNNHDDCDDDGNEDDEGAGRTAAGRRRRYFGGRANSVWSHPGSNNVFWGYWTLAIFFFTVSADAARQTVQG